MKITSLLAKSMERPHGYIMQETYNDKLKKKTKPLLIWIPVVALAWFYISAFAAKISEQGYSKLDSLGYVFGVILEDPIYPFHDGPFPAEAIKYYLVIGFLILALFGLWMYSFEVGRIHHDVNTLKGSSEWADPEELSYQYGEYKEVEEKRALPLLPGKKKLDFLIPYSNSILSQHFQMSLDTHINPKAVNTLILGTTGTGKSRFFLKPNLLQMNASYVITDPSGGILQQCGETLRRHGYNIRIFDINNMGDCSTYNPMKYCYAESDVNKLVSAFIKNTQDEKKSGGSQDPFWDDSMNAFLCALVSLLVNYGMDPEIMNGKTYIPCFANLAELTRMANKPVEENGKQPIPGRRKSPEQPTSAKSELNIIFENVRKRAEEEGLVDEPYCLRMWENFKIAPEKTSTTILMTVATRLKAFNISEVKNLTTGDVDENGKPTDTICLDTFDDQKDALFIIIPTNDRTYNFLAAFLYTQLFDILYRKGEHSAGTASVKLANNELVHWFNEADTAAGKPEEYLQAIKNTVIERVEVNGRVKGFVGKGKNKKEVILDDSYYEIKLPDGTLVSRRPTEKKAKEYQAQLKKAKLVNGNGQALPMHVRFLMDEFPNIGEVPEFKEKLSTIRKYEISVCVICQTITQLKGMYPDDYEVIDANCPVTIFLGGDENSNNEYISKKLGKTTVIGVNGSVNEKSAGSHSYNVEERDLMKPEELGRVKKCIVMLYGEQPVYDDKFDYVKHKNYKYTQDFGADCGLGDKYMVFDRTPYAEEIGSINPIDHNPKRAAKKCTSILPALHSMRLDGDLFKKIFNRPDNTTEDILNNITNACIEGAEANEDPFPISDDAVIM